MKKSEFKELIKECVVEVLHKDTLDEGSWASENLLADTEINAVIHKLGRQALEQAKKEWWGPGMSKEEKNKIVKHLLKNSVRSLSDMLKQYADDMDRFDSRA